MICQICKKPIELAENYEIMFKVHVLCARKERKKRKDELVRRMK